MCLVKREVRGQVAHVTLNRPESLNALNVPMRDALQETWHWINGDAGIRVVVLTGAGERAFCVGADLKDTRLDEFDFLGEELFGSPPRTHFMSAMKSAKPVICAINGYALGGGLELALAADIRVAAVGAQLGLPEVKIGSMPGAGATQYLMRAIGRSDALRLLLSGDSISAEEAYRIGLVSACVEREQLLDESHKLAVSVARNAPLSVMATLRAARADLPLSQGLAYERALWGLVRKSEDRAEGRRAFREGRPPKYQGR